ncbi:MAG: hypothetical protein GF308_06350 [Candidatus Heimdallarchaeota archaeon]|nr:hypothetical protein [Candidatus Heimdallarchaeota archaeon]
MISLIEPNLKYHYELMTKNKMDYFTHLIYTEGFHLNLPYEVKRFILGAAISANDPELFSFIINHLYCNILDVRDAIRLINSQQEIPRLTSKRKKMINELFFAQLSPQTLLFHLLKYSTSAFQEVIDLTHPHPDIFQDKTFQKNVYGEKGGKIGEIKDILKNPSLSSARELIHKYRLPFHYLKSKLPQKLVTELIPDIFEEEGLSVLIRNYEEFKPYIPTHQLKSLLSERISNTDSFQMNLGELFSFIKKYRKEFPQKVTEKLCTFCDVIIDEASQEINLGEKVAIIGDASGSMSYAIDFATILTSIIYTKALGAELHFFNSKHIYPSITPKNFESALKISEEVNARGYTAPAVVIEDFLVEKKQFNTIIFVTDEQENTKGKKYPNLAAAFVDYLNLFPTTKILFLTVGKYRRMSDSLKEKGVEVARIKITNNMDVALKSLQTLLYTLASPLLKEITLNIINEELDKGVTPQKIVDELKVKGYFFTLGQVLTTIDDLTMLDLNDIKITLAEMTKLKEILLALDYVALSNEITNIRDKIRSAGKFTEKLKEETADAIQKIKVTITF